MAAERKFSRIAVSMDDEDDIVIEAGAPRSEGADGPAAERGAEADADAGAEPARDAAADVADADADADFDSDAEDARGSEPQAAPSADVADGAGESPALRRTDGTRGTSLEDLEGSKMGGVQKAVIIVAVLGLIAFGVYYFCFR
ncbi:MAG TPA: hypothetical protein IAC12_02410 [Candidatus Aphodovivens avistercoris]|nr:hypothetical protein [Candidatus Aphodovivens avistercoris]